MKELNHTGEIPYFQVFLIELWISCLDLMMHEFESPHILSWTSVLVLISKLSIVTLFSHSLWMDMIEVIWLIFRHQKWKSSNLSVVSKLEFSITYTCMFIIRINANDKKSSTLTEYTGNKLNWNFLSCNIRSFGIAQEGKVFVRNQGCLHLHSDCLTCTK